MFEDHAVRRSYHHFTRIRGGTQTEAVSLGIRRGLVLL